MAHETTLLRPHLLPPVVDARRDSFDLTAVPRTPPSHPEFVRAAGHNARRLPAPLHDALVDFADAPSPAGALLLRGIPVGVLPPTPPHPTASIVKDAVSEFMLLTVGRRLGQPVGYLPEHGGDVIQNILPVQSTQTRQVSTSSKVELMFHTEAAFHPHRPRYLLLLCLRGDRDGLARTTLSSIREVAPLLDEDVLRVLAEPRFRTAPDESYVGGRPTTLGPPVPVLTGERDELYLTFDADLMTGTDPDAERALETLAEAVAEHHTGVVLEAGDLLVVDNALAVHGRTPFTPRFDGADRWLQRTFVVADLAASAGERRGRVITTTFA